MRYKYLYYFSKAPTSEAKNTVSSHRLTAPYNRNAKSQKKKKHTIETQKKGKNRNSIEKDTLPERKPAENATSPESTEKGREKSYLAGKRVEGQC